MRPIRTLQVGAHLAPSFHQLGIGRFQRVLVKILKQRCIQPRMRDLSQNGGGLRIVKNDLMRRVHHDHGHRDLRQDRGQPVFLRRQAFCLGRKAARRFLGRLRKLARNGVGCRRQIAQIAGGLRIDLARHASMRPHAQLCRQPLDRFGYVFIKKQPDTCYQSQHQKPDDQTGKHIGVEQIRLTCTQVPRDQSTRCDRQPANRQQAKE